MKQTKYIIWTLLTVSLAVGCGRVEPDVDLYFDDADITFAPEITATKALMEASDLADSDTRIKVYDYLTGFTGKIGGASVASGDVSRYIDGNTLRYNNTTVWPFADGTEYRWTKTGSHTFFGWLDTDNAGTAATSLFNNGFTFNTSTRVLSIGATTMTAQTTQFDFSYSGITTVNSATRVAGSTVPLQLQHLFSALKISMNNTSGNKILLKSVKLIGMKNRRSATVDFSGDTPSVTTTVDSPESVDVVLFTSTNPDGDEYVSEDLAKTLSGYILMWPQIYVDLLSASLEVEYKIKDSNDQVSDDLVGHVVLSNIGIFKTNSNGMDAGTKYSFLLEFRKSSLALAVRVLPWEYEEYDWDYSDHSIAAKGAGTFKDGVLAFYRRNAQTGEYTVEPTTDEWSAKTMRFTTRNEIMHGKFYIEAPTSGQWKVDPFPMSAAQYFIITPASGDIDVATDNGKAEFEIRVDPDKNPTTTQTLYFNVAIFFNGEWHDANSEFNRKNIKLVLDAN